MSVLWILFSLTKCIRIEKNHPWYADRYIWIHCLCFDFDVFTGVVQAKRRTVDHFSCDSIGDSRLVFNVCRSICHCEIAILGKHLNFFILYCKYVFIVLFGAPQCFPTFFDFFCMFCGIYRLVVECEIYQSYYRYPKLKSTFFTWICEKPWLNIKNHLNFNVKIKLGNIPKIKNILARFSWNTECYDVFQNRPCSYKLNMRAQQKFVQSLLMLSFSEILLPKMKSEWERLYRC